jgi:hypothetical protein
MKKKITLIFGILFFINMYSQAPQKMSYQSVVRNSSNVLVANAPVGIRISILQGSIAGASQYTETQTVNTNANGLATLSIGSGTIEVGSMSSINWANGPFFIKTETDPTGGTNYSITGTSELMSVPYALYAANSPQGAQGPQGVPGPAGLDGAPGLQGPQGVAGADGANGLDGATGPMGPQGIAGSNGTNGLNGLDGATGPMGPQGPQGVDGINGLNGATGPMGPQGLQGIAGSNGTNGLNGLDGATGPMGPQGPQGVAGADGINGLDGATGPMGPQGLQGIAGSNGTNGLNGLDGATGPMGPQGPQGVAGADGINGLDGATGPMGPQGLQGIAGVDGTNGLDGATGPQGPQGIQGIAGVAGVAGTNGLDGATGPQGPQGPQGLQGLQGIAGVDGTNGLDGATGPQGPQGIQGIAGVDGINGLDGAIGPMGMPGMDGPQGPQGEPGPMGPQGDIGQMGIPGMDGMPGSDATVTVGAISSSSNSNGATINSGELSLAPADASNGGIVTTSDQTFAGSKTFNSNIIGNLYGNATSATNIAGGSLGQIPYQNSSNTTSFLPADTSTSRKFLSSIGSNGNATAPTWQPIRPSDIISSSSSVSGNLNFETSTFGSQSWTELDTQWNITEGWANLRDYNGTAYQGSYSIIAPDSQDFTLQSSKDFNLTSLFIMGDGMNTATSIEFKGYTAAGELVGSVIVNTSAFNFNFSNVTLNFSGIRKLTFNPIGFDPNAMGGGSFFLDYFSVTFATSNNLSSVNGILKSNGNAEITGAVSGTDFLAPTGSAAGLTNFPTLNQNTTGTASNVSGVVAIANGGTAATTSSEALTNLGAAPINSPNLSGTPTAPTATPGTDSTQLATTAFVTNAVSTATSGAFVDLTSAQTVAGAKTFTEGLRVVNKPFLPTKLTQSQINSLTNLEEGMVVYNTDSRKLQVYSVGDTNIINDSYSGTFTDQNLFNMEQSFIPPTTGVISAIQLFVKSDMDPFADISITIKNLTGTNIGGGGGFLPFANYGSPEWITITLNNISVNAGETYRFRVMNYMYSKCGTNSNYFNGSLNAICCGPANGDDLMFKIMITPTNGTSAYWISLN